MKQEEYARLETSFQGIRDEKGVHANTAVRIGTAFLELLRMTMLGEFDEISFNKVINKPQFLQGLISLGSVIFGEYEKGLKGGVITEEGVGELKDLWVREHIKAGDGQTHYDDMGRVLPALEVSGDSTFSGNLSSPEFVSAFFGGLGWAIQKKEVTNAAGVKEVKYTLEIDNAVIRNTLRVFEMIVSQLLGENANRFFSDMMEVDHYDPVSGRVYLKTHDGRLYNPFRKDDIVVVQQYNGNPSAENNWYVTKAYELRITDVGVGSLDDGVDRLDWVTFTDFTSYMGDSEDTEHAETVQVPALVKTRVAGLLDIFEDATGISVPAQSATFGYLSILVHEAYSQFREGKSAYSLPYLFDKSLFPNIIDYYGSEVNPQAFEGMAGWLIASVLTEIFPGKRNALMKTGFNLGPDKSSYIFKYTFESDPYVGRLVASVICSALRGVFRPNLDAMRSELGAPAFNYNIADVSEASFDTYKSAYYPDLTLFLPTAPGPYVSGYANRSAVGGVPFDADDRRNHNLQPDVDVHNKVVAEYNLNNSSRQQEVVQAIANKEMTVDHVFGANRHGGGYTFHPVFGRDTIGLEISVGGNVASAYDLIANVGKRSRSWLQDGAYYGRKRPGQGASDGSSPSGAAGVLVNLDIENSDGTPTGYSDAAAFDRDSRAAVYANSYPSGHSSAVFAGALFLIELMPRKADLILKAANLYAMDRQITRYHWLSDTIIGRLVGAAVMPVMRGSSDYSSLFRAAWAEIGTSDTAGQSAGSSSDSSVSPVELIREWDTFVREDNLTDPNRKGLMSIMAVGENTPYMDFLYGLKTDPDHAHKGRMGNLEGVYNHLFGWLQGFGQYLANAYIVGDVRLRRTGESLDTSVQMMNGRLSSNMSEVVSQIQGEENYLSNPSFSEMDQNGRLVDWNLSGDDVSFYTVGGLPVVSSVGTLADSRSCVKTAIIDGSQVLYISNGSVSQSRLVMRSPDTHREYDEGTDDDNTSSYSTKLNKLYMSVRVKCLSGGTMRIGFPSSTMTEIDAMKVKTALLERSDDWNTYQWEGTWDGKSDFSLSFTGECYIQFLSLSDDRLSDLQTEYSTSFLQTIRNITFQAKRITKNGADIATLEIRADQIQSTVESNYTDLDGRVRHNASVITQTAQEIRTEVYNVDQNLRSKINSDISSLNSSLTTMINAVDQENDDREANYATWKSQTDKAITAIAAKWDKNGNLIGYSTTTQTASMISSAVYGLAKSSDLTALDETLRNKINSDISSVNASINAVNQENDDRAAAYATWKSQTDQAITAIAGKWDKNGNLIGYSTTTQTASAISSAVVGLAKSSDLTSLDTTLRNKINSDISSVNASIDAVNKENDDRAAAYATWKSQTDQAITAIAGKWDKNGNLIGYSTTTQTSDLISSTVTKSYIQGKVDGVYANKNDIPDVSNFVTTSQLNQKADSITANVAALSETVQSLDESWVNGTYASTAGYSIADLARSSSTAIRYTALVPVTSSTAFYVNDGYEVNVVFFDSSKESIGSRTSVEHDGDTGKPLAITVPSGAVYAAIYIASGSSLSPSGFRNTGFMIVNKEIVTQAYLSLYVDKTSVSWLSGSADNVVFNFNKKFQIQYKGTPCLEMNGDSNLYITGELKPFSTIGSVLPMKVDANGNLIRLTPDNTWVAIYAGRFVKYKNFVKNGDSFEMRPGDDLLLSNGNYDQKNVYLPLNPANGKIITIKNIGGKTVIHPAKNSTQAIRMTDQAISSFDLNTYDRIEFVFYEGTWWGNVSPI